MTCKGSVLAIDDDRDFLEFVRIILEANGYEVYTAEDAEEGLALARRIQPDIALVDVMISYVLDGLNLTKALRDDPQCGQIPIILISAIVSAEQDAFLPKGKKLCCDAFMSKPVEPRALLRKVAELAC
jgi:CheY-like chemotaxis protein